MEDYSATYHLRRDIEIYESSFYDIVKDLQSAGPESDFWKKTRAEYPAVDWQELLRFGKSREMFPKDAQ
jgi:hypothetical protein